MPSMLLFNLLSSHGAAGEFNLNASKMSNLVKMTILGGVIVPLMGEGDAVNLSTLKTCMSK